MSEETDLHESIAHTIRTYRHGELATPTPEHVARWASQFTVPDRLNFLREFDHVIKQTFITEEGVKTFLGNLVKSEKFAGAAPATYWAGANFLTIQRAGQSQKAMVNLFAETLAQHCGLELKNCGSQGGDYIYLDDVLFTGGRVATDLIAWIEGSAPPKAIVHVIVMALHTSGLYYLSHTKLPQAIAKTGKDIKVRFWRSFELENQRNHRDTSQVLWPAAVPDDEAVQAYVASETRFPLVLRNPGRTRGVFSSEEGRQLLEREFLIAGVKIRSLTQAPKDFIRPLGCSGFGVGFGSTIATYRNCPNNSPLALWWGDPNVNEGALHWYPLLSRKTYAAPENVFNEFVKFKV
ncbi:MULTISPECIES: hypothetical protein [Burkholderia]|uniref:phosphoribosyltransferase-like protein n=1 Tax=Burkholderia TaxID=32008 RepID=UPI000572624D|nr:MULTISPECIES: hypothetical protein [Burkholderia]KVT40464.1 hypothetical protein WK51_11590 [Burkholderia ubonensis]